MSQLQYNIDLVYELTKKEVKARYKSSVLGYLWSLLNPIGMAIVFYVAFEVMLGVRLTSTRWPFALFLIAGLFPWQWFTNSVLAATNVYVSNANLIRKLTFRRELLPLATVLNDVFHFLVSIIVILGLLMAFGGMPSWRLLYGLPALMAAQLLLTFGLALIVSSLNLFFRDLNHLISILLQMWFYFTPIIYDMDRVAKNHPRIVTLLKLNPMTPLVEAYRQLLLEGQFDFSLFVLAMIHGTVALVVGWLIHSRLRWKFAEII